MDISIILIIVVIAIYLVWKSMNPRNKKKPVQRRFNIRKHRHKETGDDEHE